MIKAPLHAHKEAERDMAGGAQIIPCQDTPMPITGASNPSKAHLHKQRGAQEQVKSQIKDPKEGTPCPDLSQGCPGRPSAPASSHETHHNEFNSGISFRLLGFAA